LHIKTTFTACNSIFTPFQIFLKMKNLKSFALFFFLIAAVLQVQAQSANTKVVMDGYAKFGAGDIPGVLALLSPDIVWKHAGDPAIIPFAGTFRGQPEVGHFFEAVGKSIEVTAFNPTNFREEGNKVINDTHIEGTVISTGKKYVDDVVMTWTFGPDGKPVGWEAAGTMSGITAAFAK
jgi:uncharacterized protein